MDVNPIQPKAITRFNPAFVHINTDVFILFAHGHGSVLAVVGPPCKMLTPPKNLLTLSMKLKNMFLRLAEENNKVQNGIH